MGNTNKRSTINMYKNIPLSEFIDIWRKLPTDITNKLRYNIPISVNFNLKANTLGYYTVQLKNSESTSNYTFDQLSEVNRDGSDFNEAKLGIQLSDYNSIYQISTNYSTFS